MGKKRKSADSFNNAVTSAAAQAVAEILRRGELTRGGDKPAPRKARARYDNARPDSDTARAFARSILPQTPLQLANPADRASLRRQARDCCENGAHAGAMARLFALYVVGSGARLRFLGYEKFKQKEFDDETKRYIEYRWREFATDVRFSALLRAAMQSIVTDGEAFVLIKNNPRKREKFDLYLIDAARVGNPNGAPDTLEQQDGISFDVFGNVESYTIYDAPTSATAGYLPSKYQTIPADLVFHLFRQDFAEQTRGISWFAPCLNLLQQLNEYTKASIEAAKQGARVWATIETSEGFVPSIDYLDLERGVPYDSYSAVETPNGKLLTLPPGTTARGFSPTQPNTAADAYTANLLSQIGYALGLPRNKATGSSHEYNFASGRLDNQPFELLITTLQRDLFERDLCDRVFKFFYKSLIPDLIERGYTAAPIDDVNWEWIWADPPLVDAEATARTASIQLKSGQRSMREVWERLHPEGDFNLAVQEIKKEAAQFPEFFGATGKEPAAGNDDAAGGDADETTPTEATRIDEPKAAPVALIGGFENG